MPPPIPSTQLGSRVLGSGSFALVFEGVQPSGAHIAVKQSRVSLRVRRPGLQHEARILHRLQGHNSIPELFGYYRGPHFEYIGLQLLGPTLASKVLWEESAALKPETVLAIGVQLLSALEHLQSHGVVHRDVKPTNVLLSESNTVFLVDFGIASLVEVIRPPPRASGIVGTLQWCSIHVHEGRWPLRSSDDLESLAYMLIYCLGGTLPWYRTGRPRSPSDPIFPRVAAAKKALTGTDLARVDCSVAASLGQLLDYVRSLPLDNEPLYPVLIERLSNDIHWHSHGDDYALDFSSVMPPLALRERLTPIDFPRESREISRSSIKPDSDDDFSDSNMLCMRYDWDPVGGRPKDLTFPILEAEERDRNIQLMDFHVDPSAERVQL